MKRDIMKFVLKSVTNGNSRRGVLERAGRVKKDVETPMCMLYTRGGSAPHLGKEMLQKIQDLPPVATMSLNMLADQTETLKEYGKGMAKFAAMDDYLVYTCLHDPSIEIPSGYNDKGGTAIWGRGGKIKLDVEQFVSLQENIQADFCQALSDHNTNTESSRKRANKSVDRTLSFLDQILEQKSKSGRLKDTEVFGVIEGGYHEAERERSARETAAKPVSGFVIEGFHSLGPKSESFEMSSIETILNKIFEHLPEDKPRVMQALWPPDAVVHAVQLGIDIFDSSYAYSVTERGGALVFCYDYKEPIYPEESNGGQSAQPLSGYEINLKDKIYTDDVSPLLKGCTCYTCSKFTRAYINHLLLTSELLAGVLLMIHNFHHYFQFFKTLRQALTEKKFQEFKDLILSQKR